MKLFKKSDDYEELIINFLNKENLLDSNKEGLINALKKNFSDFSKISESVFDELVKLIETTPQLIIDRIKSFASDTEELTTIFTQGKKEYDTVKKKMEFISLIWETATLLNFAVFLKTNGQAMLSPSSDANSVLSHFKDMKLLSKEVDLARKIRNANNHKFTVTKTNIITDTEEIAIDDINSVYEKLESISSWWLTFITFSMYYIPKFGLMVIYGWFSAWHGDLIKYKLWIDGLKNIIPDLIKEQQKTNKKPKKKFIKWIKSKVLKTSKPNFSEEFFKTSMERVKYHSKTIKSQVDNVLTKLTNDEDKKNLLKFSRWLGSIEDSLSSINQEIIRKAYESMKSRREGKEMKHYSNGVKNFKAGKNIKAIKKFSKAIEIKPDFAKALFYRACVFNEINDYQKSINDCDEYIKLRQSYSKAYYLRGLNYYQLNKFATALNDFDLAIKFSKYYKEAFYFRGKCKLNLSDKVEGCKDIKVAEDLGYEIEEKIKQICRGK